MNMQAPMTDSTGTGVVSWAWAAALRHRRLLGIEHRGQGLYAGGLQCPVAVEQTATQQADAGQRPVAVQQPVDHWRCHLRVGVEQQQVLTAGNLGARIVGAAEAHVHRALDEAHGGVPAGQHAVAPVVGRGVHDDDFEGRGVRLRIQ